MATRRTTRTVRTHTYSASAWMFKLAFWMVVVLGVVLGTVAVLNLIPGIDVSKVGYWVQSICVAVAMIIPIIMSYQVARYKAVWVLIIWIICIILVLFAVVVHPLVGTGVILLP